MTTTPPTPPQQSKLSKLLSSQNPQQWIRDAIAFLTALAALLHSLGTF